MTFNLHANRTADGVIITEGLRVFDNNLDPGTVVTDRDNLCCNHADHPSSQFKPATGTHWFSHHDAANNLTGACMGCRHDHWFDVRLDDGGMRQMNGERLTTRYQGRTP